MRTFTATADEHPQPEPLVPWWSFGKTVLAAAALKLVEERRLSLDASIADAPYTLRHLLRHTSGLRDYGQFPEYHAAVAAHGTPWSVDEMLQRAHASSPLFAVGARFSYSNIGYLFVRQMVERAADADLDTALRRLVFDPLGIESAFVASTVADFDRIAWDTARGYDPRWVYMGCVVGSLSWAATLMHRLIHGDLLAPATKAAMFEPFPYDADAPAGHDLGYGLGVMCEPDGRGGRAVGHAGQGSGSTIVVFSFLDRRRSQTLATAVDIDEPDRFITLIEKLRLEVSDPLTPDL